MERVGLLSSAEDMVWPESQRPQVGLCLPIMEKCAGLQICALMRTFHLVILRYGMGPLTMMFLPPGQIINPFAPSAEVNANGISKQHDPTPKTKMESGRSTGSLSGFPSSAQDVRIGSTAAPTGINEHR